MDLETAKWNYEILQNLKPMEKLIVHNPTGKMDIDNRYALALRRTITSYCDSEYSNSRDGLIGPLIETYRILDHCDEYNIVELINSLDRLHSVLQKTYEGYQPLFDSINNIMKPLYAKKSVYLINKIENNQKKIEKKQNDVATAKRTFNLTRCKQIVDKEIPEIKAEIQSDNEDLEKIREKFN